MDQTRSEASAVMGGHHHQQSSLCRSRSRDRRFGHGHPISADEIAVQKHLSRVYARVAGQTLSSINSIFIQQTMADGSPSIKLEGGFSRSNQVSTRKNLKEAKMIDGRPSSGLLLGQEANVTDEQLDANQYDLNNQVQNQRQMEIQDNQHPQSRDVVQGRARSPDDPEDDNDFDTSEYVDQNNKRSSQELSQTKVGNRINQITGQRINQQNGPRNSNNQNVANGNRSLQVNNRAEQNDQNQIGPQIDQENEHAQAPARQEIQRKRQRNKEKYRNENTKSGSSRMANVNGEVAGIADFQESGSNYGQVMNGGEQNIPNTRTHRPWRQSNINGQRISEIQDDTNVLTKSLTALNSRINNENQAEQRGEDQEEVIFKRDVEDIGIVDYRSEDDSEGVMAEGNGQNFQSEDYYAPNESSAGPNGNGNVNFSRSNNQSADDVTVLVQQCKLKRQRFMYLGKDAHTIENYGGKAEALKAFRSQIANINDRNYQNDEVLSEQSQSTNGRVDRKFRYGPIRDIKRRGTGTGPLLNSLAESQNKLQMPTMSLLGQRNKSRLSGLNNQFISSLSPRKQVVGNDSAQDIESIHSQEDEDQLKQGNTSVNQQNQVVRPSEETIFLSSQGNDSHQVNQIDDQGEIRLKSMAKLSNKAMQTSLTLSPQFGQETAVNAMSTPLNGQTQEQVGPNYFTPVSTHTAKIPYSGRQTPNPNQQPIESKPNVVQCEVVPDALDIEQQKYLQKVASSQPNQDEYSCQFLTNYMKTSQIQCIKYNSSMDNQTQKQSCFDAFISLSNDGHNLLITNIRHIKNNTDNISMEDDCHPSSTEEDDDSDDYLEKRIDTNNPKLEPQNIFEEIQKKSEWDIKQAELQQQNERKRLDPSSASCKLSEIQAFIYGGFSSRFWMLRKHINSMNKQELKDLPFHAWNCITLKLGRRDVDLVIKDETQMQIFIKFLLFTLCTLDGTKDSAKPLLQTFVARDLKTIQQQTGQNWVSHQQERRVQELYELKILKQISFKYKVMRVRAKIGFMALLRGLTIQEIFLHAIYKTYVHYIDHYKFDLNDLFVKSDQTYQGIISFETNLKMIAQAHKDKDMTTSQYDQSTNYEMYRSDEQAMAEQLNNFKNNMKKSWQMVLDPSLGNPYRKYENQAKNLELYTKEQLRKKKTRSSSKKKSTTRPSADQIKQILRKDKVMEIFKDVMVNKAESLFSNQNIATFVAHKFKRKLNMIRYAQINLFINLGLISGPRYIEALLVRIRLSKERFLLDLQQGMEVLIPYELSQDHLPMSYRYYDAILQFIQDSVTQDRRDFQRVKMKLGRLFDKKLSLQETLGIQSFLQKLKNKKKLVIKRGGNKDIHVNVEDFDMEKSKHIKQLQRSQYVLLDDDRSCDDSDDDHEERSERTMQEILGLKLYNGGDNFDETALQKEQQKKIQQQKRAAIAVRYLRAEDVLAKRQQLTGYKMKFQTRQNTLKQKGQYLETSLRLNAWIVNNFDELYRVERERRLQLNPDMYAGLTPDQEEKEMLKYRRFLSDSAEQMVLTHRTAVQTKKADSLRDYIKSAKRYDLINKHLDELIEEDILYFNAQVTDGVAQGSSASIRALYRAKQRQLNMMRLKRQQNAAKAQGQHAAEGQNSPRTPKIVLQKKLTAQEQLADSTPQDRMQDNQLAGTPAGSSVGFSQLHHAHQQAMQSLSYHQEGGQK